MLKSSTAFLMVILYWTSWIGWVHNVLVGDDSELIFTCFSFDTYKKIASNILLFYKRLVVPLGLKVVHGQALIASESIEIYDAIVGATALQVIREVCMRVCVTVV